mgnify:CR=1 FL=1
MEKNFEKIAEKLSIEIGKDYERRTLKKYEE